MESFRKKLEAFGPIPQDQWEKFTALTRPITFQKGEILQREGDTWEDIYFIEEGLFRIYYLKDGVEYIRQFFFEGGIFSELASTALGRPSRLYMDVVESGKGYRVAWKEMRQWSHFQTMALADSVYHVSNRMASLFLDTPEQRYQELVASRPKVMERIPQYMIAAYLGVTPEGLSRLKKRLKKNQST